MELLATAILIILLAVYEIKAHTKEAVIKKNTLAIKNLSSLMIERDSKA
jgi:hypothetical protein